MRQAPWLPWMITWINNPNIKNFYSDAEWDKVRQDDGKIYWIPQFGNVWEKDMKRRTRR